MNIFAVIVDELPKDCIACGQRIFAGGCFICSITHERIGVIIENERISSCPLIIATQYAKRNALIQAPSRSVARRTKLMRGER